MTTDDPATPGTRYDRWTVVREAPSRGDGRRVVVECACALHPQRELALRDLVRQSSRSCGCASRELAAARLRGDAGAQVRADARATRTAHGIVPRAQAVEDPARIARDRARVAALRTEARARGETSPRRLIPAELHAVLGDGEGRSTGEVARALGLPLATAYARLVRHRTRVARGADRLWRWREEGDAMP